MRSNNQLNKESLYTYKYGKIMSDKNLPVYSYSKNSYHICDYVKESFKIPFNESVIWMKHETKHSRIMKGINPT